MTSRLIRIARLIKDNGLDAYLVTQDANIRYLTGFPAEESWLFVTVRGNFYLTDARYSLSARQGLKKVKVVELTKSLFDSFAQTARSARTKRIGFDERHLSVSHFKSLRKACPRGTRLIPCNNMVEDLREIKTPEEVRRIRACLKLNLEAYTHLSRVIRPGLTEREVLLSLEKFVKARKAGFSFDPIIAAGPNSCYPHAKVTDRKIRENEPVLVDMGIDIGGYKSDLTRMFFLGKIPPHVRRVTEIVRQAQSIAAQRIKPGVKAAEIDRAAREFLKSHNLARYFGHSLGHGVGLQIHERPWISQKGPAVLKEGMVFTLEPAVYIPNKFGIRIEDMVVVTKNGYKILSQ